MLPRILLLSLPLLLSGCSSLSEEECRTVSWYNLGYQDGQQGKTRLATSDYASSCGEYGLRVDEAEWKRGYEKGLELYCLPELAYSKGKAGQPYLGVCPHDARFLTQYERGQKEYQLEKQLANIKKEMETTQKDIERLELRIRNESDSEQRSYYQAQRERAIRNYEGLRRDYNRLRVAAPLIHISFGD